MSHLAAVVRAMADAAAVAGDAHALFTGDTRKSLIEGMATDATSTRLVWEFCARELMLVRIALGLATRFWFQALVGDHGMAIMSVREGLEFEARSARSCAALNGNDWRSAGCGGERRACDARSDARWTGIDAERDCILVRM